jgi:hypothetical protein
MVHVVTLITVAAFPLHLFIAETTLGFLVLLAEKEH